MSYDLESQKKLNEALYYIEINHCEQAIVKLDEILANEPNSSNILLAKANCLFSLDRYDEATECCNQVLMGGYKVSDCNYLLGKISMLTDKDVEAEEHFLEALRENPQRADIIATYGYLMLKTGYDKKAKKLMDEALKIDPLNEVVLHYKFYYHLAKDKSIEQIEALEKYLQVSSSEICNLIKIGMIDVGKGDYKSARESFRQAFLLDPTNQEILSLLKDVEESSSILFIPQRMITKIGGPGVIWIGMIITFFGLKFLGFTTAAGVAALIYFILCVYTWVTPSLYKAIMKRKN